MVTIAADTLEETNVLKQKREVSTDFSTTGALAIISQL